MQKLNIVPYPNSVKFLGSQTNPENINRSLSSLTISDEIVNPEGYRLVVGKDRIEVVAGGEAGAFYAGQTFLQLKEYAKATGKGIPMVEIVDEPAFGYRGFMVDCARHMVELDDLKKLIDAAALLKLNVMHWHLTDDQGWRIEIESYPDLIRVESKRHGSHFGKVHDSREYSGYYTKDQLREIVDYCAKKHIEVIPEIDMPGHMIAAIASYPELSCTGKQIKVESRQGIFPDILCAGKDETYEFVTSVLGEVMDIFPSKYIHIGGDEAPKKRWAECPHCQAAISKLDLNDEEELQGWFMNRIAEFLRANGRKAITWNEALKSGLLADDITVQMWMDRKNLSAGFANRGGKLIISPFFHYYTDYPYGMTPLNKTYKFNPILKDIEEDGVENVLGVEAPIWTEHVRDFEYLSYMTYPRFAAVAETGWTYDFNKNPEDFNERMRATVPLLEALGVKPAPAEVWNPSPWRRLIETLRFYKNTITMDMIKGYK